MTLNESFTVLQNQLDNVSLFRFGNIPETGIYNLSDFFAHNRERDDLCTCCVYDINTYTLLTC